MSSASDPGNRAIYATLGRIGSPFRVGTPCRIEPVFAGELGDANEGLIGGYEGVAAGERGGGDQQVVGAERLPLPCSQFGIDAIGRLIERQYGEPRQDFVDTPSEPRHTPLGGAKAQFRGDDNAGQDIGFAALAARLARQLG